MKDYLYSTFYVMCIQDELSRLDIDHNDFSPSILLFRTLMDEEK